MKNEKVEKFIDGYLKRFKSAKVDKWNYEDGSIWAAALLAFWKQWLEYLLINLGCHEAIELVMPCVGVRILL